MSIGFKDAYYTLVESDTGTVHKMTAGSVSLSGGVYTVIKQGTDILTLDSVVPNVNGGYKDFRINDLVGAKIRLVRISKDYSAFNVFIYEGSYSSTPVRDRVMVFSNVRRDIFEFSNYGLLKRGLFICFTDNAIYEGKSIIPCTFPVTNNGGNIAVSNAVNYEQRYIDGRYLSNNVYCAGLYYNNNSKVPADRLLRTYHTLSYSDSGDLKKQAILEVNGFPYGSKNEGESKPADSGQGEMQDTSTPIIIDAPRTLFLGQLFRVYKLGVTALSELSNFLLSPEFLTNLAKLFNDPMDYLISLSAMPTNAFNGSASNVKIGNIQSDISGVLLSNFFVDIDCGAVPIVPYYKTFLDYSPYMSITLYLVGVGNVNLNPDLFVGQSVHVKYRVDALTGQCLVFVSNDTGLVSTHSGNIAYHIPLRSKDYSEMFSGAMATLANAASVDVGGTLSGAYETAKGVAKPHVIQGGAFGGNTSIMLNKKPYLIIERPSISVPKNYGSTIGYMSRIYSKLGDLSGFTVVENIHLDHVTATDEEKAELESLLKAGVIL